MPYEPRIMGRLIAEERRRKGMSQENLSAFAGLSRSHLAMIESGDISAKAETLWRIADALGIRLSELFAKAEAEAE